MTAEELSEKSGVARNTISRIERGVVEPQAATVHKLAAALGISAAELLQEPALAGKAKAPGEAGQAEKVVELSSAERAGFIEGVAAAVVSVADRTQERSAQTDATDDDALTELLEDTWLTHRGARQLLEEINEEAAQLGRRETPAERRARSSLERAVMRLTDLAEGALEATFSGFLEEPKELEGAEERANVVDWDFRSRRAV
jgi:transcriptional regulator with XRE-family HTH domain